MKGIHLNDIHLAGRGPASRLDDWPAAVFAKLEQVLTLAKAIRAEYIGIAGDVFHHKTKVPYGIVSQLIEWCTRAQGSGIQILCVPGNHDEQYDRRESIPNQALGVLFASGAMKDISYEPAWFSCEKTFEVIGVPYPDAVTEDGLHKLPEKRMHFRTVLAHCFAGVSGGTYFGEPIHSYHDLSREFPEVDVWHFGHDHADHGVMQIGAKWFINLGALTRGSIALEDINRDVQQVRLNVAPAGEVFDLALKAQRDAEAGRIEQFVTDLSAGLLDIGPLNVRDRVDKIDVPEAVRKRVMAYIEAAEQGAA
jgi:DNA repair exonuclease SbcCD nuclease subunit